MINTYHAELEFDWWDRGQDFTRDLWGGRVSLRKIWVLIQMLPPGSAFNRKVDPDQWRAEHYVLADIYDLFAVGQGVTPKGSKAPVVYQRPADRIKRAASEKLRNQKLRDARTRFQRQLAAGGDVGG